MKLLKYIVVFLFLTCSLSCFSQESKILANLLFSDSSWIMRHVLHHADNYRLQIIYTEIDRSQKDSIHFHNHYFRYMPEEYFYPASMVKLPLAALVLEWLHENNLSRDVFIKTKANNWCTSREGSFNNGKIAIKDLIARSLIVSDNNAFNELYELLGPEYINTKLHQKGFESAKIIQRLKACNRLASLKTDTVMIYEKDSIIRIIPGKTFETSLRNENAVLGQRSGKRHQTKGKDFCDNNFISLHDLHQLLIDVAIDSRGSMFKLRDDDRYFLMTCMSAYPHEWNNENFGKVHPSEYKYFLSARKDSLPTGIRIFNKVGLAFGFMIDCAYIIDYNHDREFFLSAVIFANQDQIIGDGKYEYATVGYPFLKRMSELIYHHELKSDRKNVQRVKLPITDMSLLK